MVCTIVLFLCFDWRLGDPTLTDWTSVTVSASQSLRSLRSEVTITLQQLVPGATYQFRVFAVNSQGISASSPMSEHFYSAGWFANKMAK